jgi:hypothetical protein
MIKNPFPKSIHQLLSNMKDENNINMSWYTNLTLIELPYSNGIPINGMTIFLILLGFLASKHELLRNLVVVGILLESIYFDQSFVFGIIWILLGFIIGKNLRPKL